MCRVGQASLAKFGRVLRELIDSRCISVLLINTTVRNVSEIKVGHARSSEARASLFESVMERPALGKSYANLVDVSAHLFRLPGLNEASSAIGDPGRTCVLEVLKDRTGAREGRWAAFRRDGASLSSYERLL